MEKHLTFEGIEINCSLDEFIAKLEKKGLVIETPPFGDEIMWATMRGEYADYEGICKFLISTPVSSLTSRCAASSMDSPISTNPPGNAKRPFPGSFSLCKQRIFPDSLKIRTPTPITGFLKYSKPHLSHFFE